MCGVSLAWVLYCYPTNAQSPPKFQFLPTHTHAAGAARRFGRRLRQVRGFELESSAAALQQLAARLRRLRRPPQRVTSSRRAC